MRSHNAAIRSANRGDSPRKLVKRHSAFEYARRNVGEGLDESYKTPRTGSTNAKSHRSRPGASPLHTVRAAETGEPTVRTVVKSLCEGLRNLLSMAPCGKMQCRKLDVRSERPPRPTLAPTPAGDMSFLRHNEDVHVTTMHNWPLRTSLPPIRPVEQRTPTSRGWTAEQEQRGQTADYATRHPLPSNDSVMRDPDPRPWSSLEAEPGWGEACRARNTGEEIVPYPELTSVWYDSSSSEDETEAEEEGPGKRASLRQRLQRLRASGDGRRWATSRH